jgi:hypothetical protein
LRSAVAILLVVTAAAAGPRLEGFSSLKVLPGAREAAMGGTGVAAAVGPQAIALNPAAVADVPGFGVAAGYTNWLLDTHHQSLFAGRNLGWLSVAAGVTSFSGGRFEYRVKPTDEPLGTFEPMDLSAYIGVGRRFNRFVSGGVTGRYFYSKILEHSAAGVGLDLGVRVRPMSGLGLGASLVDFGKTMYYEREVFWLPTRARLGASYDFRPVEQLRVTPAVDGSYYIYQNKPDVQAGFELAWKDVVALRFGYDALAQSNHLSCGLGLRTGLVSVDYALAPLSYGLGVAHRFTVGIGR